MHRNRQGIAGDELRQLLPHREGMFLLSRVTAYNIRGKWLDAEYDVGPGCIFFDHHLGGVPSWTAFEFMAQSISALSGIAGRRAGLTPRAGFILQVSDMRLDLPFFANGDRLEIHIHEDASAGGALVFIGEIRVTDTPAASGRIMVMEAEASPLSANQGEDDE